MEDYKNEVNHIVFVRFKEEVSEEQKEECIKQYANLAHLIPSINSFKWGKELAIAKFEQGFTHVFESTFDSAEDVAEYISDPHHIDFRKFFVPKLDKYIVVDFKTTKVP